MRTLGVDLASQAVATASCAIGWSSDGGVVDAVSVGLSDEQLLNQIGAADVTGIDAPFGWPLAEAEAVYRYAMQGTWSDPPLDELRFRLTERRVRERTGRYPLSSTSDWIAWVTWRCVRLLSQLVGGGPVERVGEQGVFEVYPAGALRSWGIAARGYKTDVAARERILADIQQRAASRIVVPEDRRVVLLGSHHAFDAWLAALAARVAARSDRTTWPPTTMSPREQEQVLREGWIHIPPPDSLAEL